VTVTGKRTLLFALYASTLLLAGLALLPVESRGPAYVFFAGGIGAMMGAVAAKASVDALSQGDGSKGLWANLTTPRKPGDGSTLPVPGAGAGAGPVAP
jgi:hypothetical protein